MDGLIMVDVNDCGQGVDGRQPVTDLQRRAALLSKAAQELRRVEMHPAETPRPSYAGRFAQELADGLKDPMTAAILYAQVCTLWLGGDAPNLTEASRAAAGAVKALQRANDIIERLGSLRTG